MKIITVGLDSDIFNTTSPVAERFRNYGHLVEKIDIIIPQKTDKEVTLSDRVHAYGIGGSNTIIQVGRLVWRFGLLMRKNNYDVISTKDPYYLGLIALYLARHYSLALEIQVHGFEKYTFFRRQIARFVLQRADGIRTVSKRLRSKLVSDFNIKQDRITVCPIFVDCEHYAKQGGSQKRVSEPFTFITIGRLVPIKNISLQIRALQEVRGKHPVRLLVVGDGPQYSYLHSLTKKLDLESEVTFTRAVRDIVPLLHQADCFLMTSFDEGYGMAPIEAACFGLPVIMTDVGCAGDIIVHQENGIIIPINNHHALVVAMNEIIENNKLRNEIMLSNKNIYNKLLTYEQTLSLYLESWKNTLVQSGKQKS